MAVVPPSAPILFELTPGNKIVTLSFSLQNDSPFTDVLYSTNDGPFLSLGATAGPVTIAKESDDATEFVNGTAYTIKLVGVSDEFPYDHQSTLTTPGDTFTPRTVPVKPNPPQIISTSPGDGVITIIYRLGDNGGSAVTSVLYTTDSGTTYLPLPGPINGTDTITTRSDGTPLENGVQIVIQLKAENGAGNTEGPPEPGTPSPTSKPADSPFIHQYQPGDQEITVYYDLFSDGGSNFKSVWYSTDNGTNWSNTYSTNGIATFSKQSGVSEEDLVNDDKYQVRLLVTTEDYSQPSPGTNIPSNVVDITPTSNPPGPPAAPTLGPWTAGDKTLTVPYNIGNNGGSSVTNVFYSTDGGETWKDTGSIDRPAKITTLSTIISTPLVNEVSYPIQLRTVTISSPNYNVNPPSYPPEVMRPSNGIARPGAVSIISANGNANASADIAYSLPTTGGSTLTNIWYSTDAGLTWDASGKPNGSSFTITTQSNGSPLENNTTYDLLLVAATQAHPDYENNPKPISTTSLYIPSPGNPPTAPSRPKTGDINIGDKTFNLQYSILSTGGNVINDILYSTDAGSSWKSTGVSSSYGKLTITKQSISGTPDLVNGTQYSVVLSVDTDNFPYTDSDRWSQPTLFITTQATPTPPDAPTIGDTSAGDGQVQIQYDLGPDNGSQVVDVLFTTDGGSNWRSTNSISGVAIITTDSLGNNLVNDIPEGYTFNLAAVSQPFLGHPEQYVRSRDVYLTPTGNTKVPPSRLIIGTNTPGNQQIDVSFSFSGSVGSGVLTDIYYSTDNGEWITPAATNLSAKTFTITTDSLKDPLVNGRYYSVRIVAVTSPDYLDPALNTPSVAVNMRALVNPVAPTAPQIMEYSPGDRTLTVTYTLSSNGGSNYTNLWYSTNNGVNWKILNVGSTIDNSTSGIISELSTVAPTPLTNGVFYRVRLMATTISFPTPTNTPSGYLDMRPSGTTLPPSAPVITSWYGIDGALVVNYSITSDGGSSITAIYYSTDGGLSWDPASASDNTVVITTTSGGSGPIVDSITYGVRLLAVTFDFPSLSNPSSPTVYMVARPTVTGTFKPKGMSYTEFLRSKKADRVKIIDTKPVRTASEITNSRRLGASTVFALNNRAVKGTITTPIDFSQGGLHAAESYFKEGGASRRVGSASEFTAFSGSQAIGGLAQAGLPPTRLSQPSNFILVSAPVTQGVSDYLRRDQGCKVSLGQPHNLSEVTPSVFVDNTIRNTGSPACETRPAIHDIKEKNAFAHVPNRPSQAEGQYALKGDLAPGNELGAVGGNPHYKAGAALDNIPYVEKHHGNDLGVNPKRPFVKFRIPKGTPPHLKINRPKLAGGYVAPPPIPPTLLEQIATLTSPNVYTLNATTVILSYQTLTIPLGITLKIPPGLLLTNNGTIVCLGTIDNDAFINNGRFRIESTGTFITTVVFTNRAGATLTNSGAIRITSGGNIGNAGGIIINVGATLTNSGAFTNNSGSVVINYGTVTNNTGSVLTNFASFTNNTGSRLTNSGTVTNNTGSLLTNYGTVTNNTGSVLTNFASFTNNTGSTVTNSGIITNNSTGTLTNNGTITSTRTSTLTNIGTITNNSTGTITGNSGITYSNTGTNTNTGTFVITQPITNYVPYDIINNRITVSSNVTIPRFVTITNVRNIFITSGATFTNNGTFNNAPYYIIISQGTFVNTSFGTLLVNNQIFNSGTLTNNGAITNTSTITNNSGSNFTNNSGGTLTNTSTIRNNSGSNFTNNSGGTLTNSGTITSVLGSTFTNNGTITNTGTIEAFVPLTNYATLVGSTYTLNSGDQIIPLYTAVTVPATFTLVIPISRNLENNGTIVVAGTLTANGPLGNNGRIINNYAATININNSLNFQSGGSLLNNGTITISGGASQLYNPNTVITNNATINVTNGSTFYSSGPTVNSLSATITINASATMYIQEYQPLTNHGTITSQGTTNIQSVLINNGVFNSRIGSTFDNYGTIYNYGGGIITVDGTKGSNGEVNNPTVAGACGTGTLNGTNALTRTGTSCPP